MKENPLMVQSVNFAVEIIRISDRLKENHEYIISDQMGRSGTSIGANIREAQYAQSSADFVTKLRIALKEANETEYWLELALKTGRVTKEEYEKLEADCRSIRTMLSSSIRTTEKKLN